MERRIENFMYICFIMKLTAFILSVYIFFLAMQPALTAIDFPIKMECCSGCCGSDCEKSQSEQQQDNDCNGICNPFLSCNCVTCVGFMFSFNLSLPAPVQQVTDNVTVYIFSAIPKIAIPIWHPPKIS